MSRVGLAEGVNHALAPEGCLLEEELVTLQVPLATEQNYSEFLLVFFFFFLILYP